MSSHILRVTSGPAEGTTVEVDRELNFGRGVDDEGGTLGDDPQLSRHHARISRTEGGSLQIEDLGSTNGTFLNGKRITSPQPLRPGDEIALGMTKMQLVGSERPTTAAPIVDAPAAERSGPAPAFAGGADPGAAPTPAPGTTPLNLGGGPASHPAVNAGRGVRAPFAVLGIVLGLVVGLLVAWAIWGGDDEESSASATGEQAFDGTFFTLSNGFAPKYENSVLAYRTTGGSLLPQRLREYPTGGTGARNINLNLAIDGENELNYDSERKLLFAVNPGSDTIAVFRVADDLSLNQVEGSPFRSGGIAPISTDVSGDTLLVVNKGQDGVRSVREEVATLTQFKIASDGRLTPAGRPIPLPNNTNPTQVLVTRNNDVAVISLERGNEYIVLKRAGDGTFRETSRTPITDRQRKLGGPPPAGGPPPPAGGQGDDGGGPPPGQDDGGGGPPAGGGGPIGSIPEGALGMEEHPQAPVIYSELPSYSLLMVHEYDDSGALKFVRGVRVPKGFLACWAKVTSDGRFLYVANTGDHTIAVFDVSNPRNPKHLQSHPVPGPGGVASMQLDEEAKAVYAIDHFDPLDLKPGDSNRVHAFKIAEDGRLSGGEEGSVRYPVAADVSPIGGLWLDR